MTDALPDVSGSTTNELDSHLYDMLSSGRYALVWWHPQVLPVADCKTCTKELTMPVRLIQEIYESGCDIIGLTYENPDRMARYLNDIGIIYPTLSVSVDEAKKHGVAKSPGEPWESIPHQVGFLINDQGHVINRYEVKEPTVFLRTVLGDVKAGPPPSKWEPAPKRGFWSRLFR